MTFLWIRKAFLNRRRTFPCIAIIALIVAAIAAAIIFSESMMAAVSDKLTRLYSGAFRIYSNERPETVEGVAAITHAAMGYGILYGREDTESVAIKGVEDTYFTGSRLDMLDIVTAVTDSSTRIPRVTVGSSVAQKLKIKPGDKAAIMLMSPDGRTQPVLVYVNAVFSSGVNDIDDVLIYAPFDWAATRFDDVFWEVELEDGADEDSVGHRLRELSPGFGAIRSWKEINYDIYVNFENSRANISAVLGLCLLLGAVYVVFIANETVRDDRQRLAVLLMLGATKRRILLLSLKTVMAVLFTGILTGLVLGVAAGENLSPFLSFLKAHGVHVFDYYTVEFKAIVPYLQIGKAVAMLAVLSVVSAYFTLRRILRISPMEIFVR